MKRQQRQKRLTKKRRVAGSILTLLATLLCASYVWLESYFSDLTMDKMVFQMKVPMEGTGVGIIFNYLMYAVPPCLIMGGLLFLLLRQKKNVSEEQNRIAETGEETKETKTENEKKWKVGTVIYEWLRSHIMAVSSIFLIGTICFGLLRYDIPTYLYDQTHPSK